MPLYIFKHPEKEEYKEVMFSMDEEKLYQKDGKVWERVFSSPQLNTSSSIDPWDNSSFVNTTSNTKGNMGDLIDRSKEMSLKRAEQNNGVDPVKQKYFENYSKKRAGQLHPDQKKKSYESKNIKVDYD
ncbi:MAG: hypothetical protein CMM25_01640 [Rhodospirillaceae bacterium]|nr:hypothetical protein [Rhodospirillaceae bacterium]|tara:strand:+ start:204 stop:587 length:384 start_codon:yes stop_codon:yes gene_type:complete